MKLKLLLVLFLASLSSFAQYTLIPDVNFENKLITLGIDSGTADGQVLTVNIAWVTTLDVSDSSITNLVGIQDFVALTALNCSNNRLTALDVSKNIALTTLFCSTNKLINLNLANGNNTKLVNFDFTKNPNLSCIQVDDVAYANTNWATAKDATAGFSKTPCPVYTFIPDINFEKKMIAEGVDSGTPDGKVLTSKISSRTYLSVPSGSITDLTGIQDFVALTTLFCHDNQLTSLDLSKNIALTKLECGSNKLTSLNVSKNTALTELLCRNNQLTRLDVSKNTALINLGCDSNQLTTLDVSKNTTLTYLWFSDNQLTNLDLSKNIALTNLDVSVNQLTNLDVSKNTALEGLYFESNQLTSLDVSNNSALINLTCSHNKLTALDLSKNTALAYLWGEYNNLTGLNVKNGNKGAFVDFDVRYNPNLRCIQVDDVASFNTYRATAKDATANYSANCPPPAATIKSKFEDKLITLGIDTDGKNGSVLLSSIANVTTLDVSNFGITDLSGIEYFTALETLNCQGNLLTTINVSYNAALKYLDCSKNPLTALDVSKNTQLTELYCDGIVTTNTKINAKTSVATQLTALNVSKNVSLTKLNCSNNQLVSLDLSKNTLLTDVNCSNNKLTSLNVGNGNNSKLVNVNFKTNASLSCILVDDVAYANTNWSTAKDATAIYSKTTCTLGIEDVVFDKITVYPNPTKGEIHIDNCIVEKATAYDALGKLVKTTKFDTDSNNNTINLAGLPSGIYYIYLENKDATIVKKIILE